MEEAGPPVPGLRPSPADLRWTRTFRRSAPADPSDRRGEAAVLRLRIGERADGEPVLLEIGSEAWFFSRGKSGEPACRAFRMRRSLLISGEDPWQEVPPDAEIAVLDPEDPLRSPLVGSAGSLCDRLRAALERGAGPTSPGGTRAPAAPAPQDQLEDARRALRFLDPAR